MLISRRLIRSARLIIISVEHVYIPCNCGDYDSLKGRKTCLKHIYLETLLLIQMRSSRRPYHLHMHAIHARYVTRCVFSNVRPFATKMEHHGLTFKPFSYWLWLQRFAFEGSEFESRSDFRCRPLPCQIN